MKNGKQFKDETGSKGKSSNYRFGHLFELSLLTVENRPCNVSTEMLRLPF